MDIARNYIGKFGESFNIPFGIIALILEQINILICMLLTFVLGYINRFIRNEKLRLIYSLLTGMTLQFYMYGYSKNLFLQRYHTHYHRNTKHISLHKIFWKKSVLLLHGSLQHYIPFSSTFKTDVRTLRRMGNWNRNCIHDVNLQIQLNLFQL